MSEQSARSRNEGVNCLYAGEVDRALAHLQGAVEEDPEDAQAQGFLGVCYVRKGNFAAAIPPLEQAVRLQPEDAAAHYNLAAALYQTNHHEAARVEVDLALSLNPAHVSSRNLLERMNGGDSVPVYVPVVPAPDQPPAPSEESRFGMGVQYPTSGLRPPSDLGADHSLDDFGTSVPGLNNSLGIGDPRFMGLGQAPFTPINLAGPDPEPLEEPPASTVFDLTPLPAQASTAPVGVEYPASPDPMPTLSQPPVFRPIPSAVPPYAPGQRVTSGSPSPFDLPPLPGQAPAQAHSTTLVASGPGTVVFQAPPAPSMSGGEAFGRRFAAYFIDFVMIPVVLLFAAGVLLGMVLAVRGETHVTAFPLIANLLSLLIDLAVVTSYAAMLHFRGQTPGKMALGIQVVGPDGSLPGFFQALGRETIGQFISGIALGFGYWRVLWNGEQRAWHDELFGTRVVRK